MTIEQKITPSKEQIQQNLNDGFGEWSKNHADRFSRIGTLPCSSLFFPDQKVDRPKRRITRAAVFLPETAYLKFFRTSYAKVVGSKALAATIIDSFRVVPALPYDESVSLTDYTIETLKENSSIGIASAHADRLSDITDFTAGLSLAVAEEVGREYIDRFGVVVNKNMSHEGYIAGHLKVPLPWLISTGLTVYWGIPSGGAKKYGIWEESEAFVNLRLSESILSDKRARGLVLGVVPAGSGMVKTTNEETGELEKLTINDASHGGVLLARLEAGVIPVNRFGDKMVFDSVVPTTKPADEKKKDFTNRLTDSIVEIHARQVSKLAGVPVEFTKLSASKTIGLYSSEGAFNN